MKESKFEPQSLFRHIILDLTILTFYCVWWDLSYNFTDFMTWNCYSHFHGFHLWHNHGFMKWPVVLVRMLNLDWTASNNRWAWNWRFISLRHQSHQMFVSLLISYVFFAPPDLHILLFHVLLLNQRSTSTY